MHNGILFRCEEKMKVLWKQIFLQSITLSKVMQTQKDKYRMLCHTWIQNCMFENVYACGVNVGMKLQRGPGEDQGSEKAQEG